MFLVGGAFLLGSTSAWWALHGWFVWVIGLGLVVAAPWLLHMRRARRLRLERRSALDMPAAKGSKALVGKLASEGAARSFHSRRRVVVSQQGDETRTAPEFVLVGEERTALRGPVRILIGTDVVGHGRSRIQDIPHDASVRAIGVVRQSTEARGYRDEGFELGGTDKNPITLVALEGTLLPVPPRWFRSFGALLAYVMLTPLAGYAALEADWPDVAAVFPTSREFTMPPTAERLRVSILEEPRREVAEQYLSLMIAMEQRCDARSALRSAGTTSVLAKLDDCPRPPPRTPAPTKRVVHHHRTHIEAPRAARTFTFVELAKGPLMASAVGRSSGDLCPEGTDVSECALQSLHPDDDEPVTVPVKWFQMLMSCQRHCNIRELPFASSDVELALTTPLLRRELTQQLREGERDSYGDAVFFALLELDILFERVLLNEEAATELEAERDALAEELPNRDGQVFETDPFTVPDFRRIAGHNRQAERRAAAEATQVPAYTDMVERGYAAPDSTTRQARLGTLFEDMGNTKYRDALEFAVPHRSPARESVEAMMSFSDLDLGRVWALPPHAFRLAKAWRPELANGLCDYSPSLEIRARPSHAFSDLLVHVHRYRDECLTHDYDHVAASIREALLDPELRDELIVLESRF